MKSFLIKNGRIWDGARFFSGDVLIEQDRITQIAPSIQCDAQYTYDAAGKIVSAGLVDLHMHMRGISPIAYGMQAEMACFPFGVTAGNDAGSFLGDHSTLKNSAVKNTLFSGIRITDNCFDVAATEQILARYGSSALGIKVYFDLTHSNIVRDLTPLQQACAFARERGLKVMVHCAHSPTPMADIVRTLSAGDILTHIYHGAENTCADDRFACLQLAREKGIVLDAGFAGYVHTDLQVFQAAVKAGYAPDTISTDITPLSAYKRGGRYGMTLCMSMARTAGMPEEAIFRCVTSAPAKALGMPWGNLAEGGTADLAVLEYTNEPYCLTDANGNTLQDTKGYRCKLTIADGVMVFRD